MAPALDRLWKLARASGNYAGAMVARGLELVGKLGLYTLGARALGVHDSGYFFLCLTWVILISTVARGGFEKAVVRHIAADLAVGNGAGARAALLLGAGVVTAGGILAAIATFLLAGPVAVHVFDDAAFADPLKISALAILPQTLTVFIGQALVGHHRGGAGQLVQNGLWPVLTLAPLAFGIHSLDGILYALAGANAVAAAIGVVLLLRERRQWSTVPAGEAAPHEPLPALWRTAFPLSVVEIIQIALPSLPVLLLATFGMPAAVGAFSVANRISMLLWVVSTSIGVVAAPKFAAYHRQEDWDNLRQLNRRVRLAVAVIGLPMIAVMLFLPGPLLHLIGPGFEIAATGLVILGLGQLVYCFMPCQEIVLAMTGHGAALRLVNIAQALVCVVLCVLLIPPYGLTGAAIATAVFAAQYGLTAAYAVRRLMPKAF